MLVYGDAVRIVDRGSLLAWIDDALGRATALPAGLTRHAMLVAILIEAGGLAQGLADATFERDGQDDATPVQTAVAALLTLLAAAVWTSWRNAFAVADLAPLRAGVRSLAAIDAPDALSVKLPEGFAFYAVYPEGYAAAAAASGLGPATRVIGIRSIGAPLGAMVAAALAAPTPVTVRPVGHPFGRTLRVSDALRSGLCTGEAAIVDEGPGLSGSSFGAVIDMLEQGGVPERDIALFPSHGGDPGPQAGERQRARWGRLARHVMPFDDLVLHAARPEHRLATWVADLLGAGAVTLEEVSGGGWRRDRFGDEAAWPPVNAWAERRKFLAKADGTRWLLKFAGLGREGERKFGRARRLAALGVVPPVVGLVHGFLVERWMDEARPLDRGAIDPAYLAGEVGRYLGIRAASFPAGPGRGASLADLRAMARHNTAQALGHDLARGLDRWTPDMLDRLGRLSHPVETDSRLQPWEWSVLPDGRLLKHDALDHHAAHDLVGCQDIAWDVVGATVELDFGEAVVARLCAAVAAAAGRVVERDLVAFLTPCYLAFQLGSWTMAGDAAPDADEAKRLADVTARHAKRLAGLLRTGA